MDGERGEEGRANCGERDPKSLLPDVVVVPCHSSRYVWSSSGTNLGLREGLTRLHESSVVIFKSVAISRGNCKRI